MKKNEMCDFAGRNHEFLLRLKKAGLNDDVIKKIINSKGNEMAIKMMEAYKELAQESSFELVKEISFQNVAINESEAFILMRNAFRKNNDFFDPKLNLFQGNNDLTDKRIKASLYKINESVSQFEIRKFIEKKGNFPGFYGLVSFWFSLNQHQETELLKGSQLFAFEKIPRLIFPFLVNFKKGGCYLSANYHKSTRELPQNSLILVLNDE